MHSYAQIPVGLAQAIMLVCGPLWVDGLQMLHPVWVARR
jgi:hypothetical protein